MLFCSSAVLSLAAMQAKVFVPVTLPSVPAAVQAAQLTGLYPLPLQDSTATPHSVATGCPSTTHPGTCATLCF